MSVSKVRVGVRIRPLVAKEKGQVDIIEAHDKQSLVFKGQTFTYDHVFGSNVSQSDLYENTAGSMLKNFLEGYNCTIIAYGQTGSGKTFSMGTSDLQNHESSTLGLIPRFVNDLFENLNHPEDQDSETTFKIKASFLEIYGEDVYDLLAGTKGTDSNRNSLPVREDEHGKVFVQGQVEHDVQDAESALESLSLGSMNRITASTAMNAGSSRSHAVYTLTLEQRVKNRSSDGNSNRSDGDSDSDDVHLLSSKLTFVDLAGSERIKRTGAEGQRMKEGIQINSGLFNLGQVINCLADEQRLKGGSKAAFVPYRNSKLTHLLKDALGGNSQTLFLACVSPAESNESETYSTLSYARQARNIQNKPVQNVDESQAELRRLKCGLRTWMLQAVKLMFPHASTATAATSSSSSSTDEVILGSATKVTVFSPQAATLLSTMKGGVGEDEASLLQRPEVVAFIESVNASIREKTTLGASPSPRKVRLSVGAPTAFRSPSARSPRPLGTASKSLNRLSIFRKPELELSLLEDADDMAVVGAAGGGGGNGYRGRESILFSADLSSALEAATKVDESEQLIEKMMDMVNQEKKLLAISSIADEANEGGEIAGTLPASSASTALAEQEAEQLATVDQLIQEKEEILVKLMDNVRGYATLKAEFEKLVDAISSLEDEKKELETELEKARKENHSSTAIEKVKERFAVVKEELRRMKDDRKNKEQAYRLMQKESKQCEAMQKEVQKLKESRIVLLKQQKSQAQELQRLKKEQVQKLQGLQRMDVKKQQQMNAIKSELLKKERIIGLKEREISRISMKLKACEDHITQLLKIQQRQRQAGAGGKLPASSAATTAAAVNAAAGGVGSAAVSGNGKAGSGGVGAAGGGAVAGAGKGLLDATEAEHLATSKAVLEQAVLTQVERHAVRYLYTKKTAMLKELNAEMVEEAKELEELLSSKNALQQQPQGSENTSSWSPEQSGELRAIECAIELTELKLQQHTRDIDLLNADIDELSLQLDGARISTTAAMVNDSATSSELLWDQIGRDVIAGLGVNQAHQLLLDLTNEKVVLCKKLRTLDADLLTTKRHCIQSTELGTVLADQLQRAQETHRKQLVELEKRRVEDVWAIMQVAHGNGSGIASTGTGETLQSEIAVYRANELQNQVNDLQEQVDIARADANMQQEVIGEQRNQIDDLKLRIQLQDGAGKKESQEVDEECLNKLRQLWEQIGTPYEDREAVLQFIMKSHSMAKERAVFDAESSLAVLDQEFRQKNSIFEDMKFALGDSSSISFSSFAEDKNFAKLSKLQAIEQLDKHIAMMHDQLQSYFPKLMAMREQLIHNMNEMWLEKNQLVPSLQTFETIFVDIAKENISGIARACRTQGISMACIEKWSAEIKALHLRRVQVTAAMITLRDHAISMTEELQLTTSQDIQSLLESVFSTDVEMTSRCVSAVVQILAQQSSSNPPGSEQLLAAFEKVKLLLESVRLSRSTLSTCVGKVMTAVASQVAVPELADLSTTVVSKEQLESQVTGLLQLSAHLRDNRDMRTIHTARLFSSICGCESTAASDEIRRNTNHNISTAAEDLPLLSQLVEASEELEGMEMFVEEPWLQQQIAELIKTLNSSSADGCKQLLCEIHYLQVEQRRFEEVIEVQQELVRSDKALVKHIVELEEFEQTSKQDRAKALSGNSKMLIEEEKFRKAGKRKYEQITEKMVQLYQKLVVLAAAATSAVAAATSMDMTEIKVDVSILSPQGQLLVRGGVSKEKVELMRLHTSAAASVAPLLTSLPPAPPASSADPEKVAIPPSMTRRTSLEKENNTKANVVKKENGGGLAKPLMKTKSDSAMISAAKPASKLVKIGGGAAANPKAPGQPLTVLLPLPVEAGTASITPKNTSNRRMSFQPPTPPAVGEDGAEIDGGRRESGETSDSTEGKMEAITDPEYCNNVFSELIR